MLVSETYEMTFVYEPCVNFFSFNINNNLGQVFDDFCFFLSIFSSNFYYSSFEDCNLLLDRCKVSCLNWEYCYMFVDVDHPGL